MSSPAGVKPRPATALEARGVVRRYRRRGEEVRALDGLDLALAEGSMTALLGPSGSGKSTLARCLALLEKPDAGEILHFGRSTAHLRGRALAAARRAVQLVPQDPARSLGRGFTTAQALAEPLIIAGVPRHRRREHSLELLARVGLDAAILTQRARSLSGGQAGRLALARALACQPRVLILDEAFAGLDLSLRARLVNLVLDLLEDGGLTCLLATHDRSLAQHVADRVVTLEGGALRQR